MKKENLIAVLILLMLTATATFYLIDIFSPSHDYTGMSSTRMGKAYINFNRTPPPPPPPPPPSGPGGGSSPQVGCCNSTIYQGVEYLCRCYISEYNVIKIQPTICCKMPDDPKCKAFCRPVEKQEPEELPKGTCPDNRLCGSKCCKPGEECRNGQCRARLPPPIEFPSEPPELEPPYMVVIPFTEYSFPWWYFVFITMMLFILSFILWHKAHANPKTRPAPAQPAPAVKKTVASKTRKRHKRKH